MRAKRSSKGSLKNKFQFRRGYVRDFISDQATQLVWVVEGGPTVILNKPGE